MNEILIVPHPTLRKQAKTLDKVKKEDIEVSKRMMQIMKNSPGVGLAANQIGILKRIIAIRCTPLRK